MAPQTKTLKFHVHGMHCKSCSVLIEDELKEVRGVSKLHSDFKTKELLVEGEFTDDPETLAKLFTEKVKKHGYSVALEGERKNVKYGEFKTAVPIALVFVIGFIALQKLGIVNLVGAGKVTLGTAFLVGIIASLSTCMAVVGGLLLSMSATYAKAGESTRPQLMFHLGRLISFFILGGVIGMLGSAFQISQTVHVVLGVVIAVIMLILGINLLDVFPFAEKMQLTLPAGFSKKVFKHAQSYEMFAPFLIGGATFFLPCGFTQSMQLYALTTGSYMTGALTMLVFALGTLPVLSLLSFTSLSINKSKHAGEFFKAIGIIVIAFAAYNFLTTLVVAGVLPPVFNF